MGVTLKVFSHSRVLHALLADEPRCACGSHEIRSAASLDSLAPSFGLSRFWCQACQRHFWLRSTIVWRARPVHDDADGGIGEPAASSQGSEGMLSAPRPAPAPERLDELDKLMSAPSPAAEADLRSLDRQLERVRKASDKKLAPRQAVDRDP